MAKRLKFWTGLGIATVSGTIIAGAAALDTAANKQAVQHGKLLLMADASAEGGESGSAVAGDDRIAYLLDLALVEGHMQVGVALYKAGDAEAAKPHMKHPKDELYADLEKRFAEMKVAGFANELDAVAKAVESGAAAADVDALMAKLLAEIAEYRGDAMTAAEAAQTATLLVRKAAEDYSAGVKDGKVVEAHEYQDAWGFIQAARNLLAALSKAEREEHAGPLGEIDAELAGLDAAFPDIAGKLAIGADPTLLPATAARIELAGFAIK